MSHMFIVYTNVRRTRLVAYAHPTLHSPCCLFSAPLSSTQVPPPLPASCSLLLITPSPYYAFFFFFNDPAPPEISPFPPPDPLPISAAAGGRVPPAGKGLTPLVTPIFLIS